jgi:hypothetical protein
LKSLVSLWSDLANESARFCHTSATFDIKTVERRVENEGIQFFTITLPSFKKDFERSLGDGSIANDMFLGFKRHAGLPVFLQGFLRLIFDANGAVLTCNDEMMAEAIFCVRQLTGVFGKVELECSTARLDTAIKDFVAADMETGQWDENPHRVLTDFARISSILFSNTLSGLEDKIASCDLLPKHGPGAVADRLRGNAKFDLSYWPKRLEFIFPYGDYALPNERYFYRRDRVSFPNWDEEIPTKVVFVPKTHKTPRVIGAEPAAMQVAQQALSVPLRDRLEHDPIIGSMIGFSDQIPNQILAKEGSESGRLATIDMKEASDRVSFLQALALAEHFPWFREALAVSRSLSGKLPSGQILTFRKFAPMGSALCFPIEAMAFLAAVFVGIERKLIADGKQEQLTLRDIRSFQGLVRVYGDDIIVPVDCVPSVLDVFDSLGWKINIHKSFWTGLFRESCGKEYFSGFDVSIVKLGKLIPTDTKDRNKVAAFVAFRNQLYLCGYWSTCARLDKQIRKLLKRFPVVEPTSQVLGRTSTWAYQPERYDDVLHRPLVKGAVLKPRIPASPVSGEGALLKCLLGSHIDPQHLERSGRPSVVDMKLKWCAPF